MSKVSEKRLRRHKKIRTRISGTSQRPRLCVFKSNTHIYGQLIDDETGKTLFSADDSKSAKKLSKIKSAFNVGKIIAEKAVKNKISSAVFDRAGYKYHGRVKALADGAREGGLKF